MTDITFTAGSHAFGDGTHPSTRGAIEAMSHIDPSVFRPHRILDMGAGSGILAIVATRLFNCPVVAVDIAASAVSAITENARANGIPVHPEPAPQDASIIHPLHADGFHHPRVVAGGPYDLIIMNILAEQLRAMAHDAERHLAPGGVMILSGILKSKESIIIKSYQSLGLELTSRLSVADWVTLVLQKA
jgi:ribosomal protein L11 methyltransferase